MELKNISLNIALVGFERELEKKKGKELTGTFKAFIDPIKEILSKEGMKVYSPKDVAVVCEIESKYFTYIITPFGIMGFQNSEKIDDETKLIKEFDNEFKLIADQVMLALKDKHCAIRIRLGFKGDFVEFIDKFIKIKNVEVKNIKSGFDVIGINIEKGKHKWKSLISKNYLNLMLNFDCEDKEDKVCKGLILDDISIIDVIQDIKKLVGKV